MEPCHGTANAQAYKNAAPPNWEGLLTRGQQPRLCVARAPAGGVQCARPALMPGRHSQWLLRIGRA
ncbi:hypothetical protein CLI92_07565 [Vandammella animalimorsus]|uniref:Uncharacterized protein n=1 Tax=Vandammella animalimorsus TaxID=2029117 RepID=A0A2A2T520_9BURK|nr:hypothetical protein CK626_06295 [Vandammella animalimorsus]PAX16591.1 hypothetical protein CLI92_07565 [Vandammella animalimorsus]PAX19221.1 hypothetical protein CLI93_08585 [Vandammella animalimorsus]